MIGRMTRLWRGDEALGRAFWLYVVLYGTLANTITTIGMFAAVVANAPVWLAVLIHFLALPYNLFVVVAAWRSAGHYHGPHHWAVLARIGVIVWALIATAA
jgi:hypothetical protein